ncbi:ATP-binding cassette domain-containing protein [Scytonema sp. UIC 10036]|uniref:ABC transporter ATP-binding protein n=1 Tax=Scytonema sp. UIC 10036 TaxID=2304196 RepID=UPI0012DA2052|nr:ATP-binding cassette domain-containing protein [Scytonema sp. UIC 10036]MUG91397.1 ATP-binding cassette domain-containing protein [Scytonema sp. UIC 10036]
MSVVNAKNFTFTYPGSDESALKEISLEINNSEIIGIIGPLGAGKTTLGMAIAGLAPSITGGETSGELEVNTNGRRKEESQDKNRDGDDTRKKHVGMVFEDFASQLVQLKMIEEIRVPLENSGASEQEATDRARQLLKQVGLSDVEDNRRIWDLSGGQQQRLAIAATLAIDPHILIFDNVMDKLDPMGQERVSNVINDLSRKKTLIVVERDPNFLMQIVDRLLVLVDGKAIAEGTPEEILRNEELLSRADIEPPISLRLAKALSMSSSPLTFEEFQQAYKASRMQQLSSLRVEESKHFLAESPQAKNNFGKPAVSMEKVTFCYSNKRPRVLQNISITIHEGEVHALIGHSGAGKTTIVKHVAGLVKPSEGRVTICNIDTRDKSVPKLGLMVGTVLQNPDEQLSEKTVKDEIAFPLKQRQYKRTGLFSKQKRYDDDYIENQVSQVCQLVGIEEDLLERDPLLLPRGMRKLVTIAGALVVDPKVILLDEPTLGLGATSIRKVKQMLKHLREHGKAVLLVSNNVNFLTEVADTVTILEQGQIVMQGLMRQVFAENNWAKLAELHIQPPDVAQLAHHLNMSALTHDNLISQLSTARNLN